MSLEQKIDQLTKELILLAGKVEQRAKVSEHHVTKASQTLVQSGQVIGSASHQIL